MRFRGTFVQAGLTRLQKEFLPTLEKCGKKVQVLIGEEEVNFVHMQANSESGLVACVRLSVGALFQQEGFLVRSKDQNLVAFSADLGQLLRVLRALAALKESDSDTPDLNVLCKLISKPVWIGTQSSKLPYLHFMAQGSPVRMVHEIPISQPYTSAEIQSLVEAKDTCPHCQCVFYVDIKPCLQQLQSITEKMKAVSNTVEVSTCKNGDFYVNLPTVNLACGVQVTNLEVVPRDTMPSTQVDRRASVSAQLAAAVESGDAVSVRVQLKHLARFLSLCAISSPHKVVCGLGTEEMHVIFAYKADKDDTDFDDSVALSIKIPVCQGDE